MVEFIKITNREIYEKLCNIEDHVIKTNGKVTLNRWIASTALTTVLTLVVVFVGFVLQGG